MKKEEKETRELCTLVLDTSVHCQEDPKWLLETEVQRMYVCDAHLANAIRKCGVPALINCHTPLRGNQGG